MPISHKRKSLKHKGKKSRKRSNRNHRNKKTKKFLKNMRGGVINSSSTFDDIKIGDKFKSSYSGKIMRITDKNLDPSMEKPNITFMDVDTNTSADMPFYHFKNLFERQLFVPYITTPQSLSSLAATKVKKMFSLTDIKNLRDNGYIDENIYIILTT
jgi:hypothetical protein